MVNITNLCSDEFNEWDKYVLSHSEGTFFHLSGWKKVIENSFNHECHYLCARQDAKIVGVLPLGHIKSKIFSNALISTPFCVYGGAIADSEEICVALEDAATEIGRQNNVDYIELRNFTRQRDDLPTKDLYVTFRKNISSDQDENMKAIPRKQRAMVRKGIKAGLESGFDCDIDRFFKIYSMSVRNHGTPVFSRKYFNSLLEVFGDNCRILTASKNNEAISSVMTFYYKDEVLPYYGGGTELARQMKGFDFLYWELMRLSSEGRYKIFDYGRSKVGTGSYSFKRNWGFEQQKLPYQYILIQSNKMPDINPLNPKYKLFINMWRKLPISVANTIGPLLSRDLG